MRRTPQSVPRLFTAGDAGDLHYRNLRDEVSAPARAGKAFAEELWERYSPYADKQFLTEIRNEFGARFWEMYLACTLLEYATMCGYEVTCPKPGPDVLVSYDRRRIWVEAIAATGGDPTRPDSVLEPTFGESYTVPDAKIVLRYRSAIEEKFQKYQKYCKNGIIAEGDAYVIAVNGFLVPFRFQEPEIPRILKALFPLGALEVVLDRYSTNVVDTRHQRRPKVSKASGSAVGTTVFLNDAYGGVAGVLYSCANACMPAEPLGRDFVLAHNPFATQPVPTGLLPTWREYVPKATDDGYELQMMQGICATQDGR